MRKLFSGFLLLLTIGCLHAQEIEEQINRLDTQLEELEKQKSAILQELEDLKSRRIIRDLQAAGLPSDNYISHTAMILEYSEAHEQAAWVAHIITPDIIDGTVGRSDDFRTDSLVSTGTAVEVDYFLKTLQADSTYTYDGFGYDRGHLAPSADFRWSATALSESYFYSNISPQVAEFNREKWAELESTLRRYVYEHPESQLVVITAPVLKDGLPVIERSINKVSIPEQFVKVAIDIKNQQGVGFIMPNQRIAYPLESFAVTIDEVEALTGFDLFNQLDTALQTALESSIDKSVWFPEVQKGDVEPIYPPSLPAKHFNTVQAKRFIGKSKPVKVCGTVVSTRYSRRGNLWLNIDKQYPNQIFSVYIKKEDLINFSFQPDKELLHKQVCFEGKVRDFNGTPTIQIEKEVDLDLLSAKGG